jgi:ribonuclease-3
LLRLGEGEAKSGGKNRPSILADAVEAILGAVYLDAGFAAGEKLVHRLFEGVDINPHMRAAEKDPKTALQEWLQGRRMNVPQYSVANITGAAHKQTFDVECVIPELRLGARGQGGSRRIGEQAAAAAMLEILKAKHP